MLIILLFLALTRSFQAVPAAAVPPAYLPAPINPPDLQVQLGQRGVSDIVVSCLATIFACTWSAVHPNVPSPKDTGWMCFRRQVVIMVYALLAPEAVTAWALRQYLGAKKIAKNYNKRIGKDNLQPTSCFDIIREWFYGPPMGEGDAPAWTVVHGFFLQMGGFMLSENGVPIQTMTEGGLKNTQIAFYIEEKIIDVPRITEGEIQERSKGEAISKALVILQTTWFIAQCIARWCVKLSVTELEVVTFGFALLNGATYALWWYKPQNVGRPIYLERKKMQQEPKTELYSASIQSLQPGPAKHSTLRFICDAPLHLCQAIFRPLIKMMGSTVDNIVEEGDLRVPMFYSDPVGLLEVWGPTSAIGVFFGSVHLIPSWFLDFSTRRELLIWRTSATIITVQPLMLGLSALLVIPDFPKLKFTLNILSETIGVPIYITTRLILLTFPFLSLDTLPPGAFQTVQWTSFIPHI